MNNSDTQSIPDVNQGKAKFVRLFEKIFFPYTPQKFLMELYEKEFFYGSGNALEMLDDLPNKEYFEGLIRNSDLRFPTLSLVSSGKTLHYKEYTEIVNCGGVNTIYVKKKMIEPHFANGGSLVFNNVHLFHPSINILKEIFNHSINCALTGVNAYITPRNNKGFNIHYDNHDVVIIQLEGSKLWKIYKPKEPLPLESEIPKSNPPREDIIFDSEIKKGDVLYIPRGFPHEASSVKTNSHHITIGLRPIKWIDIIQSLISNLNSIPEVRKSVPLEILNDNKLLHDKIKQFLSSLDDSIFPDTIDKIFHENDYEEMASDAPLEL
ncbi:JmjC domain-containing protein [Maribacter flavus]|uniref:JmjC domain-containing protein n=1 Tax=Maribacter flavus TaxID=1658664 RepID=A0A5B2TNX5_9FLAO|nr:cupin domain-containing protein [Maribacter flavus]KAA2215803.1 hypothetical protein F0361_16540 [Maribacter flavus]